MGTAGEHGKTRCLIRQSGYKNSENFVDERLPECRDAPASSARESPIEPARKAVLGKHSMYIHFPKDRNCERCKGTKITMAPCRKRAGEAIPRAESFGDLITADHKVLSEGCESRNDHRYAVVVQDLETQWIQSYQFKKNHRTQKRACRSFWSRRGNQKSFTLTIPWNLAKACEDLSRNHCTSTPQRSETNGIAERAGTQDKGGNLFFAVAVRPGRKMVVGFHGVLLPPAKHSRSLV